MITKTIISKDIKKEIEELHQHFPHKSAACIEALQVIQKHHHWVSDEAVEELAEVLEMSPEAIDSVATFYNLVFRKPVGRHVILVCDSVTCWMLKYEEIAAKLQEMLGVGFGETTPDDRFTLLTIPCLGACDHAPAMMIDKDLHSDLAVDKIEEILEKYE
jgi:NADH-quinone oxidoreductase subunit E